MRSRCCRNEGESRVHVHARGANIVVHVVTHRVAVRVGRYTEDDARKRQAAEAVLLCRVGVAEHQTPRRRERGSVEHHETPCQVDEALCHGGACGGQADDRRGASARGVQ